MTEETISMVTQAITALGIIVTLSWIGFGIMFFLEWRKRKKE